MRYLILFLLTTGCAYAQTIRPRMDLPGMDLPHMNLPSMDSPHMNLPGVDSPGVDSPGGDVPGMDVPGMDLPNATMPTIRPRNSFYRYESDPAQVMRATLDNMPVKIPGTSTYYTMLRARPEPFRVLPRLPMRPMPLIPRLHR